VVQLQLSLRGEPAMWFSARLLMLAWLFYVTRRAGRGLGPFERPTWSDLSSVWLGPLVRALPTLVPIGLFGALMVGAGARAVPSGAFLDVLVALPATLVAAVTLPTVSIEGEGRRWARPRALREVADVIMPALPVLTFLTAVAFALELICARLEPFNAEDTHLERAIAQMYALHLGVLVTCTALGLVTGRVLITFATELGHESGEATTLPWVGEQPKRTWQPAPSMAAAQREGEAAKRFAPIELESPEESLSRALREGRLDEGLMIFQQGHARTTDLPGEALVTLAQGLAARGQVSGASMVLEVLLSRPDDPHLARGHVILARLMSERLNQPARARALYEAVLARFPGTAAAEFAAARLEAGSSTEERGGAVE
jgi:hypothetical protein